MHPEKKDALTGVSRRIRGLFTRLDVIVFCGAFIMASMVHIYALTHKIINHDDLNELYGSTATGIESGRWALGFVIKATGRVSSPMVNGFASIFWMALTALLVVRIFKVRHTAAALALALALVTYPSVVCTLSYMFTAPAYFFAVALAAAGVYLIRSRIGWGSFAGAALIAVSMGCYQAYFPLAAALAVSSLIVEGLDETPDWKVLFFRALRCLMGLVLALLVYFTILRLCLFLAHTELSSYSGIDSMGQITFTQLIGRVMLAYKKFLDYPSDPLMTTVHRAFPIAVIAAMVFPLVAAAFAVVKKKIFRKPLTLCLIIIFILLLPLALRLIYVMSEAWTVHRLMTYPMVIVFLLPAVAADRMELAGGGRLRRGVAVAAALALLLTSGICGYEGALITGRTYLGMELTRESVQSFFTRLTAKIELQEGYVPGSKVALIGSAHLATRIPDDYLTGALVGDRAANIYTRALYLEYFNAFHLNFVSDDEVAAILASEEYALMPVYPAEGSIATINGVIVVKLIT